MDEVKSKYDETLRLFQAADSDGDGFATKESFTATFGKWFDSWDRENRGKLEPRSVGGGLRQVIRMGPRSGR